MEHDQRVCPRCGAPAGDYRFCESCRSHIDSLSGTPTRAEASATPTDTAAQALREVARLEQALAAASKGISDRIAARASAPALEVEPDPGPTQSETGDGSNASLERARLLTHIDERVGEPAQQPPQVARLEDVLTVAPKRAYQPSTSPPEVEPPSRELAVEEPAAEVLASEPVYIAAQLLREAFWFELAAARERPVIESVAPPVSAEPTARSCPPPVSSPAPLPQPASQSSQRHWLAFVCLLALIGLVVALTGRAARRIGGGSTR